ncbi:MAG: hypothetical protein ACMUEM_04750 [Flavobacteriales bacterium AspAUS03]
MKSSPTPYTYVKYLLNPQPEDFLTFERLYKEMIEKFLKNKIITKLLLLKAIAEEKTNEKAPFIAVLNSIIVRYPETNEVKKA